MDTSRLRRVAKEMRKREDTDRDLRIAKLRQQRMLPERPELAKYEFGVKYEPATEVSGDFYDFIPVREGAALGIVVGDVSGHGVQAGIIMGMAKQTISIYGRQYESPADVLRMANQELYRCLDGKTFVSLSYAVLDTETGVLKFARAGQSKPLLINPRSKITGPQVIESKGLALGVDKGPRFEKVIEEISLKLDPGDTFFQYTDGLVEAKNKETEQFGTDQETEQFGDERLHDVLKRYGKTSAQELVDIVFEYVKDFTRAGEEEDDITMVALKVRDPQALTRTGRFDRSSAGESPGKVPPPAGFPAPSPRAPSSGSGTAPPPGKDGGLPGWLK